MLATKQHFKDIHPVSAWILGHKFRILLFMLVGMMTCYPYLIVEGKIGQTLFEMMFTGLIFVSMYVLCDTRRDTIVALILGVPCLIIHATHYITPDLFTHQYPILMACLVVFYTYMTLSVLRHVLRNPAVDKDIISGAICIYLLMGMVWAMLFSFVEQMSPGAFMIVNESPSEMRVALDDGLGMHFTVFLYFSFTTLTTLGYGDIVPASDSARSLTSLEAISGVLFIGAFVARLIASYRPEDVRK